MPNQNLLIINKIKLEQLDPPCVLQVKEVTMKGQPLDDETRLVIRSVLSPKNFWRNFEVCSSIDKTLAEFLISEMSYMAKNYTTCLCHNLEMGDMEYIIKKGVNENWELRCRGCLSAATIGYLIANGQISKDELVDTMKTLGFCPCERIKGHLPLCLTNNIVDEIKLSGADTVLLKIGPKAR